MTELKKLILYWKNRLTYGKAVGEHRHLGKISTTIRYLEELKKLKGNPNARQKP